MKRISASTWVLSSYEKALINPPLFLQWDGVKNMKKHSDFLEVYRKDTLKKATVQELESILSGKLPKEDFVLLCRYCHAEAKWRSDELKYMHKKLKH